MMELSISILTAILSCSLALFVYVKNPRRGTNVYFAALMFFIGLYAIFNYIALQSPDDNTALFWTKIVILSSIPQGPLFLFFVRLFPRSNFVFNLKAQLFIVAWVLVNVVLTLNNLIFSSAQVVDGQIYLEPGPAITVFGLLQFGSILAGLAILLAKFIKAKGFYKLQLRYITYGITASFTLTLFATLILPIFFDVTLFLNLSPFFLSIAGISIAFAVVKQKLFDVRLIVARSVAYILILVTLSVIYGTSIFGLSVLFFRDIFEQTLIQQLVYIILAVFLSFTFQPFKRFFNKVSNKIFYRDAYEPQVLLDELNKVLISSIELEILLRNTSEVIKKYIKSEFCLFEIKRTEEEEQRIIGLDKNRFNDDQIKEIRSITPHAKVKTIVTDELEEDQVELQKDLRKNDIAVLVRLTDAPDKPVEGLGHIVLGFKKSGNPYSTADIKMLEIIADELVIAIQNALRFEEIQAFSETLKKEVEDATAELRETNKRLVKLDEAKDEFISMASHQLRTPLTTIKGYLSMLLDGDVGEVPEKQKEFIDMSFISSQRMVHLISDMLNVSRISTGKLTIEQQEFDLAEVVESEVEQLKRQTDAHNVDLKFHKPKGKIKVTLDEGKIRQVIMNFTDNAIYYTPDGHVDVYVEKKDGFAEFRVEDNGIGVSKKAQEQLFKKFFRADNAQHVRPDGTGLGLYMAKQVVEAQDGEIIFASEEGKGSTFGFRFKLDNGE